MTDRRIIWGSLIVVWLFLAAYSNSLHVPFVFDDEAAIPGNATLEHWRSAFYPPTNGAATVSGRPLLNLSFALNYHLDGLNVFGYHVVNGLIHIAAALLLFGIVRRSLTASHPQDAAFVALASTALWLLHPLQTESVTYIVQRAESLAAVFILLSLYSFVRATEAAARSQRFEIRWLILSVAACWLGVLSKETAAAVPAVIACYDFCRLRESEVAALLKRWRYYLFLASSWILLIPLSGDGRGHTVGFGLGLSWAEHISTQIRAIVHYLSLAAWPSSLVFFYGRHCPGTVGQLAVAVTIVSGLAFGTLFLARRRSSLAFLGLAFFCLLVPSSALPVASEILAEHRMYLPLATLTVGLTLGLHALLGRRFWFASSGLVIACALLTYRRNADYRTPIVLWQDTVAKLPANPYAHGNLGLAKLEAGDFASAQREFAAAVKLEPNYAEAHSNLGNLAANAGRVDEAATEYETALNLRPDLAEIQANYGGLLARSGRINEAIAHVREAVRLKPSLPGIHAFLAQLYMGVERWPEAIEVMKAAVAREPQNTAAHRLLATLLEQAGRREEADDERRKASQL